MQIVEEYSSFLAQERIASKQNNGWYVVTMTTYNDHGSPRTIVVYQQNDYEMEDANETKN